MNPARSQVNESIQGLRGAAALTVMIVHVHFMAAKGGLTTLIDAPWIDHVGPYAVMLFFCISGYLIISTLSKHGDVGRFTRNRVIRLYPVFGLLHLVMFSLGPFMNYEWMGELRGCPLDWAGHFISNLLFLPGLFDLPIAQKNAWSLSYEAAFYVIAAVLFVGSRRWSLAMGKVWVLLGLVAASCVLASEIKVVFFAVGSLVWWLERHQRLHIPFASLLGLFGCGAGFVLYYHGHILLSAVCAFPFFAGLALQKGWAAMALRSRFLVWLGQVSYSLYLIHPFVLDPLRRVCVKMMGSLPLGTLHLIFVLVGASSAILAAWLSYELIEVRLTQWLFRRKK